MCRVNDILSEDIEDKKITTASFYWLSIVFYHIVKYYNQAEAMVKIKLASEGIKLRAVFFYWVWVFNMYLVCDVSSSIQGCSLIHIGLNLALIHYWDFIWHLDFSGVKTFYNIVGLALCLYFSGTQSFTCYLGFVKSFK